MILMGIDASSTCVGYSIFKNKKLIAYGKLEPTEKDLAWRDRINNFAPQIQELINKYKVEKIVQEDVPLISRKQAIVCVILGACQGMMVTVAGLNNIPIEFINVGTWRKRVGISCGEKDRDAMKVKSLEYANKTFDLNLRCSFTKSGKYSPNKSDDDIADAINVGWATLIEVKSFGRKSERR